MDATSLSHGGASGHGKKSGKLEFGYLRGFEVVPVSTRGGAVSLPTSSTLPLLRACSLSNSFGPFVRSTGRVVLGKGSSTGAKTSAAEEPPSWILHLVFYNLSLPLPLSISFSPPPASSFSFSSLSTRARLLLLLTSICLELSYRDFVNRRSRKQREKREKEQNA